MENKIPVTKTECQNFYFLVKVCGISPLDIPYMTPLQKEVLVIEHNKQMEKELKELETEKKKADKTKARRR